MSRSNPHIRNARAYRNKGTRRAQKAPRSRKPANPIYKEVAYRRKQAELKATPNAKCEVGLRNCTKWAEEVDHVRPVAEGGTNDPGNLRFVCANCNKSLAQKSLNRRKLERKTEEQLPFFAKKS